MWKYYDEKLSALKLMKVYEIAPQRTKQYLKAESGFVRNNIREGDKVLDLGCGYGRVVPEFAEKAGIVVGIDNSFANLVLGRDFLKDVGNAIFLCQDAAFLGFKDDVFDVVVCIQNGISAFHTDQSTLLKEAVRVCRYRGKVLFSSYSPKFWEHRLEWFRLQSEAGLLGEIDYEKTGNGVIVCKDGFAATTVSPERFQELAAAVTSKFEVTEVDESSIFLVIVK